MKKFTNRHKYSKFANASYVNYNNEDVLEYLQEEFPNDNFEILERNNNDIVIMDETKKEIIISFRGTQQASDWVEENSRIALLRKGNTQTKRFQTAKSLVEKYQEEYPDYKIVLTGHSMGSQISFTLGQEFDVESHSYDPAISWYNVDRNHNGKYDNNKNKQYIYRPVAGGLVSSLSRLLPKKKNIVVQEVNTIKDTKTIVDHHNLDSMYDDRKDRHSTVGSHINFIKSVLKDTQSAQQFLGGVLQFPLQALQVVNQPTQSFLRKFNKYTYTPRVNKYGSIGHSVDDAYQFFADIDKLDPTGWKAMSKELTTVSKSVDSVIGLTLKNQKAGKIFRGLASTGEDFLKGADRLMTPIVVAEGAEKMVEAKTVHEAITEGLLTVASLSAPEVMIPIYLMDLTTTITGLPDHIGEKIVDATLVQPVVQASAVVAKPIVKALDHTYTKPRHTVLGTIDNKPLGSGGGHSWVNRTAQKMVNFFHF